MDRSGTFDELATNQLLSLISSTIKSIDGRLSSANDVVHHNQDNTKETNNMAKTAPAPTRRAAPAPAARPAARAAAAPARRAAAPADDDFGDFDSFEDDAPAPAPTRGSRKPAPVEEDFGDFDEGGDTEGVDADGDFGDFEEEAPAPARGRGKAAAAPADDDFGDFEGVDGEATDDEGADDFSDAEQDPDGEFVEGDEPAEEEPVVLQPKLRNGEYILPKGSKAWYITDDGDGGWKRDRQVVDTARALKVVFTKKDHNYPFGLEDTNGKTWVALGYGKSYIICTTAEQLLDAKTKKPAKILAAAPVEEAPAPARGSRRAAPAEEAAPALSREQVIAVKKFDAAVAELKAAFGIG
jgi:hypothetical protein